MVNHLLRHKAFDQRNLQRPDALWKFKQPRSIQSAMGLSALLISLCACHSTPPRSSAHAVEHTSVATQGPTTSTSDMNRVIPNEALTARAPSGQRPTDAELLALPDAEVRAEPLARLGNPPSYVALGQRYEVLKSSKGFVERGVASWYGPNFHGEKASIGEPYNMYAMTGAHRVLPLPCYARVTNLKNGRSVVVRLNDRGPFKDNRIVDLSYAAALKLDMLREGTALVELRVLEPNGANTAAAPAVAPLSPLNPMKLYAQVGAFSDKNNAEHLKTQLEPLNLGPIVLTHEITASKDLYKVRIGPIDSVSGYDKVAAALKVAGHSVSLVDGELKK